MATAILDPVALRSGAEVGAAMTRPQTSPAAPSAPAAGDGYVAKVGHQTSPAALAPPLPAASCETGADLRSVGAIFTMTASGGSLRSVSIQGTSSSIELSELTSRLTSRLLEVDCGSRHVWFNSLANSHKVITPYSHVYGVHPRYFHFDGSGSVRLTPVGHMLHGAGLTQALCSHTARPVSRRSRSADPPDCNFAASQSSAPSTCSSDEACDSCPVRQPPNRTSSANLPWLEGTEALQLVRDPHRALEVFHKATSQEWRFEERGELLRSRVEEAIALDTEAQSLRKSVAEETARFARLRRCSGDAERDAMRTFTPEELALSKEIEQLRSKFQEVIWDMWRVKAEVDEAQHFLEEDAARMQKEFQAWLSALRRRCPRRMR